MDFLSSILSNYRLFLQCPVEYNYAQVLCTTQSSQALNDGVSWFEFLTLDI